MKTKNIVISVAVLIVVAAGLIIAGGMQGQPSPAAPSAAAPSSQGQTPATVTLKSVTGADNVAAAGASVPSARTITWSTNNYPAGVGVDINLIKKVESSPASYTFVRKIAENVANTGSATWTPAPGETASSNLYIEVVCSKTAQSVKGCSVTGTPIPAF